MDELTNVPGPQLQPFDGGRPPTELEFIERLGSGEHGHFRMDRRFTPSTYWRIELSDEDQIRYMHPFNCEYRAYARLKELELEQIAVRCYGYLCLGEEQQAALREKDTLDWKEDWGYCSAYEGRPLKALVKELVKAEEIGYYESGPDVNWRLIKRAIDVPDTAKALVRNLKDLHRAGILCKDIHSNNIVKGRFLEFSSAWTVPHPCLSTTQIQTQSRSPDEQLGMCDAFEVDDLIDQWNTSNPYKQTIWLRTDPNIKYQKRLRSHQHPEGWRESWNWNRGYRLRPDMFRMDQIPELARKNRERNKKRELRELQKKKADEEKKKKKMETEMVGKGIEKNKNTKEPFKPNRKRRSRKAKYQT